MHKSSLCQASHLTNCQPPHLASRLIIVDVVDIGYMAVHSQVVVEIWECVKLKILFSGFESYLKQN